MAALPQLPLAPMPYHLSVVEHLTAHEAELWRWFSGEKVRAEQGEAVRLDLLKSTYRLEPDAHAALHEAARGAAEVLGLSAPLTLYQANAQGGLNASLAYLPGEAHVVLHGPVGDRLSPLELRALFGHELLHFLLLDRWTEFLVAAQVLQAMTADREAEPAHLATARRFALYTEVYCDRGGHLAAGDLGASISALVKMGTGIAEASAESFLRQVEEVFGKGPQQTEGVTHPESFVRARALASWSASPEASAAELRSIIEGPLALGELDLMGKAVVAGRTRRLVAALLRPAWLQTDPLLAHARLFFEDFEPAAAPDPALKDALAEGDEKLLDYWCYVLLDFAAADRDLEDGPLAAALLFAEDVGLGERFRKIAARELGLRKKRLEALDARAAELVRAAETAETEEA